MLALLAWGYARSRRRTALKEQFGPEYDRTVCSAGSRRKAERELAEREQTHDELDLQPLSEAARTRYLDDWQRAEQRFVDDPELAAREADSIVRSVLDEKGYPDDDFDTRLGRRLRRPPDGGGALPARAPDGARQRRRRRGADGEPPQGDGRLPHCLRALVESPEPDSAALARNHGGARRLVAPGRRYSSVSRGCSSVG